MNNKPLKVTGAIILSCLVMIFIVIYIPKPEKRSHQRGRRLEEQFQRIEKEYASFQLINEVLRKANEAVRNVLNTTRTSSKEICFNNEGEPYLEIVHLNPLIETNTQTIVGLPRRVK